MKNTALLFILFLLSPFGSYASGTNSFSRIVKKVMPSIVNIYSEKNVTQQGFFEDPLFEKFFGESRKAGSLGSGIIIDSEGILATNEHVISNSSNIKVVLASGKEFTASVIATESGSDLAILKINNNGMELPAISFGDSDTPEVGDQVLAIGNPFGLGQTVTSGIISALSRSNVASLSYNSFIQTDAAINPGNSGGALIDMNGKLIGINTAIMTKTGEYAGIGFAIPVNMLKTLTVNMRIDENGRVIIERPWTGIVTQNLTQEVSQTLNLETTEGAIIKRVHAGSPAEKAGFLIGDILIKVNNIDIKDGSDFSYRIATAKLGDQADITVIRDEKEIILSLPILSAQEVPKRNCIYIESEGTMGGVEFENLSIPVREELGIKEDIEGVIVANSKNTLSIEILRGDIIRAINGVSISDTKDLYEVLTNSKSNRNWKFTVLRGKYKITMSFYDSINKIKKINW